MFTNMLRKDYGFCDLCVNVPGDKEKIKKLLLKLQIAGYNTVVLNQNIDETIFDNEKKKKKKANGNDLIVSTIPEPISINGLIPECELKLKVLNRITFSFSDPVKTHFLNQLPILRKFNIYAVVPKTQTAFQHACSQLSADIILINSMCFGLKMSRKLYLQAADRGIHFEIHYSNIINLSTRRTSIHYSHLFYTFGKSKNVVMSSGTDNPDLIRNPYDVINLARLLGLHEVKAKLAVFQLPQHVILKGGGRRRGKALFKIQYERRNDLEDSSYHSKAKKVKISNVK